MLRVALCVRDSEDRDCKNGRHTCTAIEIYAPHADIANSHCREHLIFLCSLRKRGKESEFNIIKQRLSAWVDVLKQELKSG